MQRKEINNLVRPFAKAKDLKAYWQILNTLGPYFAILFTMYYLISIEVHYLFVLPLAIPGALFTVRIFILFHDCTHSSFMKSKKMMSFFGHVFGILVFTPFHPWQREHKEHHRTVGNIDKRGTGDVWTMTVKEYKGSSRLKRFGYRLYRNPLVLFVIGPIYMFIVQNRLPINMKNRKDWKSLIITNIAILATILTISFTIVFRYYLMIQIPIIFIASRLPSIAIISDVRFKSSIVTRVVLEGSEYQLTTA